MSEPKRYIRRRATPMPTEVETAKDRGLVLQHILDTREIFLEDFAKQSKIAMSTLGLYINGELDIANMRQATAERFISTLGMSDTEAWKLFNIPPIKQRSFRTFRAPPMGHGEDTRKLIDFALPVQLQGEWSVPAGEIITIDPTNTMDGILVTELADGRLFALPAAVAAGRGTIKGELVRASVSRGVRKQGDGE